VEALPVYGDDHDSCLRLFIGQWYLSDHLFRLDNGDWRRDCFASGIHAFPRVDELAGKDEGLYEQQGTLALTSGLAKIH